MVEPGRNAQITEIEKGLKSMQKAVGGYIQAIYHYVNRSSKRKLSSETRSESHPQPAKQSIWPVVTNHTYPLRVPAYIGKPSVR